MGINILGGELRKPPAPHQVGGPSSAVGRSRIGWLTSVNRGDSSVRLPRDFHLHDWLHWALRPADPKCRSGIHVSTSIITWTRSLN